MYSEVLSLCYLLKTESYEGRRPLITYLGFIKSGKIGSIVGTAKVFLCFTLISPLYAPYISVLNQVTIL